MSNTSSLYQSAVYATNFPEVEAHSDTRVEVEPMVSPPYCWICSLSIEDQSGNIFVGTGFKIHLPEAPAAAVVTSAHCVYINNSYAKEIRVLFPGTDEIVVKSEDLYAPQEFIDAENVDYDYGFIRLPGDSNEGFGWSATMPNEKLTNRTVINCGYPGDKRRYSMWISAGTMYNYTDTRITYMDQMMAAKSGSPVYTWYNGYWTVVGVHSYGGMPNTASRFTQQMISRYMDFARILRKVSFRSVTFPNVYVRMDAHDFETNKSGGGGTVNGQIKPPSSWEKFYIWPLEVIPSVATIDIDEDKAKYAIESAEFRERFLRLDGRGMTEKTDGGGDTVNCQVSRQNDFNYKEPRIIFRLREQLVQDDTFSIESATYPHCFVRLEANNFTEYDQKGGGNVNVQWWDNLPPQVSYESFYMEDH